MNDQTATHDEGTMRDKARDIGDILASAYPATQHPQSDRADAIPSQHLEAITEAVQLVIAEIIQSWLDAGSERDVTMEDEPLHDAILTHLHDWSDAA